jgi:hypothetical protein
LKARAIATNNVDFFTKKVYKYGVLDVKKGGIVALIKK